MVITEHLVPVRPKWVIIIIISRSDSSIFNIIKVYVIFQEWKERMKRKKDLQAKNKKGFIFKEKRNMKRL